MSLTEPFSRRPVETRDRPAELRRMKRIATSLLFFFGVIFVVASLFEDDYFWVSFVRATSEAAMVGAIADWFAVTALFRYPLGLKIPHTAIVPTRKDSIALDFAHFVQTNFLSGEVIVEKVRSMNIAGGVTNWLSRPENSRLIANYISVGLAGAVQVVKDEDVQVIIEQSLTARVRATHFAPLLGNLFSVILSDERRQKLLQTLIKFSSQFMTENKEIIQQRISEETPWWLPKNVDKLIYQKIVDAVENTLRELNRDPDHPLHEKFDVSITRFIDDLKHSPDIITKEEDFKEELLQDPAVREFSVSLWADLKKLLVARDVASEAEVITPLQQGLNRFAEAILNDETMLHKINRWLEEAAVYLINAYGHEIELLISQTIQRWDAEEASRKIEFHVGRDLQFIRINGTLVGGLVGLIIHTVAVLILK